MKDAPKNTPPDMTEKKLKEQFRAEHPETIGETDRVFDDSNYLDWLVKQIISVYLPVMEERDTEIERLNSIIDSLKKDKPSGFCSEL